MKTLNMPGRTMKTRDEVAQERLNQLTQQRKWARGKWFRFNPKVYNAAMKMEEAAFSDGALSKKHKELITLAIGVITDCESCMQWQMEQAVQAGATQQEIIETLEVAIEVGVVPATVNGRFALEVMDTLLGKAHP
jgi:AhpD family alkylhydroperoxidase